MMTTADTVQTLEHEVAHDRAAILARFPGPIRLAPSRLKWGLMLAMSLLPLAAGVSMVTEPAGWFCVAAALALGGLAGAVMFLPGAGGLVLDADGFEILSLGTRQRITWADASNFRTGWQTGRSFARTVLYDDPRLAKFFMTGRLPETYGLGAHDLALLMSEWRERALAGAGRARMATDERPRRA